MRGYMVAEDVHSVVRVAASTPDEFATWHGVRQAHLRAEVDKLHDASRSFSAATSPAGGNSEDGGGGGGVLRRQATGGAARAGVFSSVGGSSGRHHHWKSELAHSSSFSAPAHPSQVPLWYRQRQESVSGWGTQWAWVAAAAAAAAAADAAADAAAAGVAALASQRRKLTMPLRACDCVWRAGAPEQQPVQR
jgi:hypothetical protein